MSSQYPHPAQTPIWKKRGEKRGVKQGKRTDLLPASSLSSFTPLIACAVKYRATDLLSICLSLNSTKRKKQFVCCLFKVDSFGRGSWANEWQARNRCMPSSVRRWKPFYSRGARNYEKKHSKIKEYLKEHTCSLELQEYYRDYNCN